MKFPKFITITLLLTAIIGCTAVSGYNSFYDSEFIQDEKGTDNPLNNAAVISDDKQDPLPINITGNIAPVEKEFEIIFNIGENTADNPDEIISAIKNERDSFVGAGKILKKCDIEIYSLITDSFLANPKYLGRKNGIKIVLTTPEAKDDLSKTLWWYEEDASNIVRNVYETAPGKNAGFVAVYYKTETQDEPLVRFLINAEDFLKIKGTLSDGAYIKYKGWSAAEFQQNKITLHYERPFETVGLVIPDDDYSEKYNADDYFYNYVDEKSLEIITKIDRLQKSGEMNDYSAVADFSDEILRECREIQEELSKMPLSAGAHKVKTDFSSAIDDLSSAASDYWYGITRFDEEVLDEGNFYLGNCFEKINSVRDQTGKAGFCLKEVKISPQKVFEDKMPINTPFHYKDAGKSNDISINVKDFRKSKSIKMKEDNKFEILYPDYGNRYLAVVVEVTHMGYRGGSQQKIKTPPKTAYTLIYDSNSYKDKTPDKYMTTFGVPYTSKWLDRTVKFESSLVFEIPDDSEFDPSKAFMEVDLGSYGKKVWSLVPEETNG